MALKLLEPCKACGKPRINKIAQTSRYRADIIDLVPVCVGCDRKQEDCVCREVERLRKGKI